MYEREKYRLKTLIGETAYNKLCQYKCFLAGGAITSIFTGKEINDFDIYFRSAEDLAEALYNDYNDQYIIAKTDKAILFKDNGVKIQFIYFRYFETPQAVFDTFDFTVCMGAFDFQTEEFILHPDFLRDNVARTLRFNPGTAFPIVSALRVAKYEYKGYTISKPEMMRILLTISQLNIHDHTTLKAQLGGMYGESYDALIDTSEELDMAKVLAQLAEYDPVCIKDPIIASCSSCDIGNWDMFVYELTGVKVPVIYYANSYWIFENGHFSWLYGVHCEADIRPWYTLVPVESVAKFPMYYYKYVHCMADGTLHSFFDQNFEYKIGQEIVPHNKNMGLFCVTESDIQRCPYRDAKDAVLIRLRVDSMDDILLSRGINQYIEVRLNRCVVDGIVDSKTE